MWMQFCLANVRGAITFQGTWKATAFALLTEGKAPSTAVKLALKPPDPVPGFHDSFLYRRWWRCHMHVTNYILSKDTVQWVDGRALTPAAFSQRFEESHQPVMLSGLQEGWSAAFNWQAPALLERFGDRSFSITASYGRVQMTMRDYLDFAGAQCDEVPLYLFDAKFAETAPEMLQDYAVPEMFKENMFDILGTKQPDFRWLVMGPARSGADWHIDPNLTSAWNALVSGTKRWALYPPGTVPPGVDVWLDEGNDVQWDGPGSLIWLLEVYPHLPPENRPLEIVQRPGETIFVPGGWWHMVLNLEDTVAVTQNFVSSTHLPTVVEAMAHGTGHVLKKLGWKPALKQGPEAGGRQGFARCRSLARWLSALHAQPLWKDAAADLAAAHAGLREWSVLATNIAATTGCLDPDDIELLPIASGSNVVFQCAKHMVKLSCSASPSAAAQGWAETLASVCIQHSTSRLRGHTPSVVVKGSIRSAAACLDASDAASGRAGEAAAARSISALRAESTGGRGEFVVMTRMQGLALDALAEPLTLAAWDAVGAGIGRLLADLHTMPLPNMGLLDRCKGAGSGRTTDFAFWQGSKGMHLSCAAGAEQQDGCEQVLVMHLGLPMREDRERGITWVRLDGEDAVEGVRADTMGSSRFQQAGAKEGASSKMPGPQQLQSRVPGQSTGIKDGAVCGRALDSDAGTPGSSHDVDKLWQPFADFLRERRQKAPLELAGEACLPLRLLQQLQEYLPDDPAELLDVQTLHEQQLSSAGTGHQASKADSAFQSAGSLSSAQESTYADASCLRHAQDPAPASAAPPLPALLHGDLIGQNILIQDHLAQHGSSDCAAVKGATSLGVNLIDFGDAGHGDPQYDLVLLLLSGFRCKQHVWKAFLSAYLAELQKKPWWLCNRSHAQPSYVAMTYALLHEQDLASIMFKEHSDTLWQLPRLHDVELAVFGVLNAL